jgi:FSR family fosmidomycin resistance protein-like MFS transporter
LAVLLAGLGSAAFHVGGGALALCATRGRASGPGLFAAPGVVGLAAGGALAIAGYTQVWPWLALLGGLLAAIGLLRLPELPYGDRSAESRNRRTGLRQSSAGDPPSRAGEGEPRIEQGLSAAGLPASSFEAHAAFEGHDLVMLVLLAGIALRSLVWSAAQFLVAGRSDALLALALAAAVGKILGGLLADRVGWRRYITFALLLAAPLLAGAGQNLWLLLPGVALLQSVTPAALAATWRLLPRYPATAAGLALGLAVAAGGLPQTVGLLPLLSSPLLLGVALLAAALALRRGLPRRALAVAETQEGPS